MSFVRYVKFRYRGERLWWRVSSSNDRTVVGRVWNHPVNPDLLFGQMIQIPPGDILDECCVFPARVIVVAGPGHKSSNDLS